MLCNGSLVDRVAHGEIEEFQDVPTKAFGFGQLGELGGLGEISVRDKVSR